MPKYLIELTDGRKFEVEADSPPSEQDVLSALGSQESAEPSAVEPEEKSLGGFLGNIPESGARFVGNTWQGLKSLAGMTPEDVGALLQQVVTNPIDTGKAVLGPLAERYGSLEKAGNTLYNDPVGAAADVSTLAGGLGGLAKLGGLQKLASGARAVEGATNPLRALTLPVRKVAEGAGRGLVGSALSPSVATQRSFGPRREIADTVIQRGLRTTADAKQQSGAVAGKLDSALAAAGREGKEVSVDKAASATHPVQTRARARRMGGLPDESGAFQDRVTALYQQHPSGNMSPLDAQAVKQELQSLAHQAYKAEEAGNPQNQLQTLFNEKLAEGFRRAIEDAVPEAKTLNPELQRLMGAEDALEGMAFRNRQPVSLGTIGGAMVGSTVSPAAAIGGAGAAHLLNQPRVGLELGRGLFHAGGVVDNAQLLRAALLARLAGEAQP